MSRYIDVNKLQRHGNRGGVVYWRDIEAQPTADVRENVRGEWVEEYDDDAAIFFKRRWVCSACGDYQTYGKPKFCPNCGADMRHLPEIKEFVK